MSQPWMPFYVGDYLADTAHLTTVQHGAYLLLIMHYWQRGRLPEGDDALANICRLSPEQWAANRGVLADLFLPGWQHKRINEERAKAEAIRSKRQSAGKAGASARYGKGMANAKQVPWQTHGNEGDCIGEEPIRITDVEVSAAPREPTPVAPEPMCRIEFDMEFWPTVVNKVSRGKSLAAFIRARQRHSLEIILDGLRRYQEAKRENSREWLNPATFLDDERYLDEPAPTPQRPASPAASRQQSILDGMAQAVERRMRVGGWEAEADARRRSDGSTGPPDWGGDSEDGGFLAAGTG